MKKHKIVRRNKRLARAACGVMLRSDKIVRIGEPCKRCFPNQP